MDMHQTTSASLSEWSPTSDGFDGAIEQPSVIASAGIHGMGRKTESEASVMSLPSRPVGSKSGAGSPTLTASCGYWGALPAPPTTTPGRSGSILEKSSDTCSENYDRLGRNRHL